ncbi:MAG: tRNA (adenosine(37)-N6)-threonylcarbamoyltransferase complex dimerization subunit type 1 TsaB [Flavobacteriaceae bacterium]|nr:tRNA (adenosine(37)-N6)-threonylcarbamoyltransferase complex dimerization subunit type 1 TsaB [Flavobacteriaceae bacterium]
MANILCIETATTNCSVALSVDGSVIAFREDNSKSYSHAERLHVFISEILEEAKKRDTDIQAVAVSKGPGSYTGLRIGVSAAKGLCFAWDLPLISVATLHTLALQVEDKVDFKVPMLDARRMEVYSAVFSSEMEVVRETLAEIVDSQSFSEFLEKGKVTFIGSGVEKFQSVCEHPNARFIPDALPSAKQMAALAENSFNTSNFEDVAYFEPYYLKDFIAGS